MRLTPGARSYIVQGRHNGEKFRLTLGPVGTFPFEGPPHAPGARDLALAVLNASRRGEDPRTAIGRAKTPEADGQARGPTLNDIWDAYEAAGFPKLRGTGRKRPSTIKADKDRYALYFRKDIGKEEAAALNTGRVQRWLDKIGSDGQRNQCLVMLKSLLSFAQSRNLAASQPIAIKATKSKEVQNFYTADELARLDVAIVDLIREQPHRLMGFAALRLLLMTGARRGEILSLRWTAVDLKAGVLQLEKDKISDNRRDILLSPDAVAVLEAMPRLSTSPFVFFADSAAGHTLYIEKNFREAVERAGLRRVRIHDLRHSFASASIKGGNSLYVTGKLLGHRQANTTQRYAHLEHDVARAALERVTKARNGG
ncbi:MAG TPA: site-specific integrase [Pseudaminobacter sp.]|nr:site-specific integrase [Pseudaminobacter sp.]